MPNQVHNARSETREFKDGLIEITFDIDDGAIEAVTVWSDLAEAHVKLDLHAIPPSFMVKLEAMVARYREGRPSAGVEGA